MITKTLYLIRGVSGAGKTSLAMTLKDNLLYAVAYAADDYFYRKGDGDYRFVAADLGAAHAWCRACVLSKMEHEYNDIIVHNTFTTYREMKPYLDMAKEHNYKVVSLVVENRHGSDSVHGVPEDVREKQAVRMQRSIKLI